MSNPIFSEDVVPVSDLKVNPGRIIRQVDKNHRPVLLTNRGRGVAVVQSLQDFEADNEERAFLKAVVEGMMDVDAGRTVSLEDAKKRLGLE